MLDDVQHVTVVAIMRAVLDGEAFSREAAEKWLTDHHPPPTAYVAAMNAIARGSDA